MGAKQEIEIVKNYYRKGYNLGKIIPPTDFESLQKQFEKKSRNRKSKNYNRFRALSLGFDTALKDRGLQAKKRPSLLKMIAGLSKFDRDDQYLDIDF
ncbi:MAG: hypothetical protein JXQ93_03215 [Flavobacteriaceae bacterium]